VGTAPSVLGCASATSPNGRSAPWGRKRTVRRVLCSANLQSHVPQERFVARLAAEEGEATPRQGRSRFLPSRGRRPSAGGGGGKLMLAAGGGGTHQRSPRENHLLQSPAAGTTSPSQPPAAAPSPQRRPWLLGDQHIVWAPPTGNPRPTAHPQSLSPTSPSSSPASILADLIP